ncbi:MAG: putative glycosyltransferase EpsJ [Bacteroidetes bacterium ADurb.Bin302]|nr:MAG: putative glycosyltransferase EpsJ [Bacteroidetes bacterium ADurb.Bin302]
MDDGSPDNCPQICDEYAAKDDRIKVIHKENGGLSDARNFGIRTATGSYLMFLDSDDYWNDSEFLLELADQLFNQPEVEVVNFGWIKYYQTNNLYVEDKRNYFLPNVKHGTIQFIRKLIEHDLFIASAVNKCVKRAFILDHALFFQEGIRSEDMDWCGRILYQMPSMSCYDKKSYVYRQQVPGSITASVDAAHITDIIQMIRNAQLKAIDLEAEDKNIYLSFFAIQYLTLLHNVNSAKFQNSPILLNDAKELRSILNYDLNYKVKTANKFMKILGFKLMSKLLRIYVVNKKA